MSLPEVTIIAERRLLAEACADVLTTRSSCSATIEQSVESLKQAVALNPGLTLVFDLEPLASPLEDLVAALEGHVGRRCGMYDTFTASIAERAFQLGARHLIASSASIDDIVAAVTTDSGTMVTRGSSLTREELDRLKKLSDRELEVLHLIARGQSSARVAATLGITPHTVDTHRRRAMRKLDTTQQSQAIALLARAGAFVTTPT